MFSQVSVCLQGVVSHALSGGWGGVGISGTMPLPRGGYVQEWVRPGAWYVHKKVGTLPPGGGDSRRWWVCVGVGMTGDEYPSLPDTWDLGYYVIRSTSG